MPNIPPPFYAPPAKVDPKTQQSYFSPEWLDYFTKQSAFLGDALNFTGNDGGAQLQYTNATTVTLYPMGNGRVPVYVNNSVTVFELPAAGITLSNSGLSNSTLYYIYAKFGGNALTLETSTTGHANARGVEVKSDDITKSLVGMVRTNGSGQFVDSSIFRGVATWFQKRPRALSGSLSGDVTVNAASMNALIGTDVIFLSWGPTVASSFSAQALVEYTSGAGTLCYLEARIDGSSSGNTGVCMVDPTLTFGTASTSTCSELAEGAHTFNLYAQVFATPNSVKYRGSYTGFSGWVII